MSDIGIEEIELINIYICDIWWSLLIFTLYIYLSIHVYAYVYFIH